MPAYIHTIQTSVPETSYSQEYAREFMKKYVGGSGSASRILHRIYTHSGIHKRHCVIRELAEDSAGGIFFDKENDRLLSPSTGKRNELYTTEAKKLFADTARKVVDNSDFATRDITHVITVSCTGFFAPGPDYHIVRSLDLNPSVQRYHIGFMGCYAAFPAMRLARSITAENPDAVILIVCLELCTIHLQFTREMDALISASVFADGAAGMLINGQKPAGSKPAFAIRQLETALTKTGEEDMAWTIGDHGFDMTLSTYVPDIIQANLTELLAPYFQNGYNIDDFSRWAVHPGGRAIIDKVQQAFSLSEKALSASRETLRDYGNMSSATILFVLKNILDSDANPSKPVLGMAFGPGLTVDTGIFDFIPAQSRESTQSKIHATVSV